MLLYGDPGVGKTLFVDHLIWKAGFVYIKIHGSTFSQMEDYSKAIRSIYEVLEYAEKKAKKHKIRYLSFSMKPRLSFQKELLLKSRM